MEELSKVLDEVLDQKLKTISNIIADIKLDLEDIKKDLNSIDATLDRIIGT